MWEPYTTWGDPMKVSKTFTVDAEVIVEMEKKGLGSEWVNRVLKKALGIKD